MALPREQCISVFQSGTPNPPALLRFPFPSYSSRNEPFPLSLASLASFRRSHPVTDGKSHRIDPLRLESIIRPALVRKPASLRFPFIYSTPSSSSSSLFPFLLLFLLFSLRSEKRIFERKERDISRCVALANEEIILIGGGLIKGKSIWGEKVAGNQFAS